MDLDKGSRISLCVQLRSYSIGGQTIAAVGELDVLVD